MTLGQEISMVGQYTTVLGLCASGHPSSAIRRVVNRFEANLK
jgi:hypothetical protein